MQEWIGARVYNKRENSAWNLHLPRPLNDREMDSAACLIERLQSAPISPIKEDNKVWKYGEEGNFSVNTYFKSMMSEEDRYVAIRLVWKLKVPSKASFLLWLVH